MEKANIKILVVDDTKPNRNIFDIVLKRTGYSQIETAVDGQEAIEKTKIQTPNLILMDTQMEGMLGYEACRIIRNEEYGKKIAIIGMSNNPGTKYRDLWLEAGADDFVSTNIMCSKETLDAKIQEVLKKYQSR